MKVQTIGLMSPGDMGQAVGIQLLQKGYTVVTALDGRSDRSRMLAGEAGIADVGSIERLTQECDVILSIMNPGAALEFAHEVATALARKKRDLLFVDCNSIAPSTMHTIAGLISSAGGRCLDAAIIGGGPPRGKHKTSLYASGPGVSDLSFLETPLLGITTFSERVGDASALKTCFAAVSKGTTALVLEALIAARRFGVEAALEQRLLSSREDLYHLIVDSLPIMPPKAYRWVPEMEQISRAFEEAGMTGRIFQGAADMFNFIAQTELGKETPEGRDRSRDGKDIIRMLADHKPSEN